MRTATKNARYAVPFLVAALAMTITPAPATSQEGPGAAFTINHFEVYRNLVTNANGKPVTLTDQFGTTSHVLGTLDFVAVNVSKNEEGVLDPRMHLTWWNLGKPQSVLSHQVVVRNQFGEQHLTTLQPRYLLAPALKNSSPEEGLPNSNGHFKCYDVQADDFSTSVTLVSQFGGHVSQVAQPIYLCNPTEKVLDGKVSPIVKPVEHLLCYRLLGPELLETAAVFTDQFASWQSQPTKSDLLCVPSTKDEVVQVEPSTWGKMKAIYR